MNTSIEITMHDKENIYTQKKHKERITLEGCTALISYYIFQLFRALR